MSKKHKLPTFKNEDQEREFWSKEDSTTYVDWEGAKRVVLPNLKPTQKTISLRLPAMMLAELKRLAEALSKLGFVLPESLTLGERRELWCLLLSYPQLFLDLESS